MLIEKDTNYQEGIWVGKSMVKNIEITIYETVYYAIQVKQELIDNFEKEFGYSREMKEFDPNYSYNMGILDALKEIYNDQEKPDSETSL